jgi:membrane-associated protein
VFDDLSDLSDSPASYLAVLALVALDAVFPVAPSETVLVTGGILIERGDLIAPVFVLAAACGAVLGDSVLFGLGWVLLGHLLWTDGTARRTAP